MFPFLRGMQYSIGELRAFEKELLFKRQIDQDFSSELRINTQTWAKLRNEELVPFEHMVNWLNIPDEFEFRISLECHSGPDITLFLPNVSIGIQVTVADPEWNGNGGRTQALENQALRLNGIAWGAGGTFKRGSKGPLVSQPRAHDSLESQRACRDGIIKAVRNKLSRPKTADCLIVYARQFSKELIDEGFIDFLQPIVSEVVGEFNLDNAIYPVIIVDGFNSSQIAFSVQAAEMIALFPKHKFSL